MRQEDIIRLDSLNWQDKVYIYHQVQRSYDYSDLDDIIRENFHEGIVLDNDDRDAVIEDYRHRHDWNYGDRPSLENALDYYLRQKFPRITTINIWFYNKELVNTPSHGMDETQFVVNSLMELGELWLTFCDENNLDFTDFGNYEVVYD